MTIAELLERVEAATGPDRDLCADVYVALTPGTHRGKSTSGAALIRHEGQGWRFQEEVCPDFTASLDAALALVERVRPGWTWEGGRDPAKASWAYLYAKIDGPTFSASAPTPALALLAALLRSLPPALDGDE